MEYVFNQMDENIMHLFQYICLQVNNTEVISPAFY